MARTLVALGVVATLTATACSGDGADSSNPTTTEPEPTTSTTETTEPAPTTTDVEPTWETVAGSDACGCADGSPFSYGVWADDPTKVVFFLEGGGACFSAETCAPATATYFSSITATAPTPLGLFDVDEPDNPVSGWSVVYVPYCTGDIHLGTRTHDYGDGVVIDHLGAINATYALDGAVEQFPDAEQILVAGVSAGAAPSPLYAGLAADRFPDAQVAVLADGAGAYPSVAGVNALLGELWGTADALPDWDGLDGVTADDLGIPDLYGHAAREHPDVVFGRYDYAFDSVQVFFAGLAGFDAANLVEAIDATEAAAEADGADISAYVAPGDDHTILTSPAFYEREVAGVSLVEWTETLVSFEPPGDVHCADCGG